MIGLAIARALATRGREVIVLEAGEAIGIGTNSRNSEVIHAGLYYPRYPRGSLKAELCVRRRGMLYEFCKAHGVPHRQCGKLLVATARNQIPQLAAIQQKGTENRVEGLTRISGAQAREMEPQLKCVEAVWPPVTDIVDSHQYMLALQGEAENHGASIVFHTPVTAIDAREGCFIVDKRGDAPARFRALHLINSAGLHANEIARQIRGLDDRYVPPLYFAKGNYFSVSGRALFERLIYPMPNEAGLGVHLRIDLGRQAKFGPDVKWVQSLNSSIRAALTRSMRRSARTGRACPTMRCNRRMRASVRSSPDRGRPQRIS